MILKKYLEFSDRSFIHFKSFLLRKKGVAFFINIIKKGCSGFEYDIRVLELKFKFQVFVLEKNLRCYVHPEIIKSVYGLKIDYVLKNFGFWGLVYFNKNEFSRCGCGKSFMLNNSF